MCIEVLFKKSWLGLYIDQFTISYHTITLETKPVPIMLLILPIIPSRISHNFYTLFLFYSHGVTYYSRYILYIFIKSVTARSTVPLVAD